MPNQKKRRSELENESKRPKRETPGSERVVIPAALHRKVDEKKEVKHNTRKIDKNKDKTYRPGSERRRNTNSSNSEGLIKIRTAQREKVIVDGKEEPYQTSIKIDPEKLKANPALLKKVQTTLDLHKADPSYTSTEIIERKPTGTPTKLRSTTSGIYLYLKKDMDASHFYDNAPENKSSTPIKVLPEKNKAALLESKPYQAVKKPKNKCKEKKILITLKLLQQTAKENALNHGRIMTQNAAMAEKPSDTKLASATKYVLATAYFPDGTNFEWNHVVPHKVLGAASQNEDNLVAASYHINTDMLIFVESVLKDIAKKYPDGYEINCKSNLVEDTQLESTLQYDIDTKHFSLPHTFNGQDTYQSDIAYHRLYVATIRNLLANADTHSPHKGDSIISPLKDKSPFYIKPKEEPKPEPKHTSESKPDTEVIKRKLF